MNTMKIMGRLLLISTFLIILVAIVSGSGYNADDPVKKGSAMDDKPGPNEVFMEHEEFNPENLTIALGTTVKWINKEDEAHDVVSGDEGSSSGLFDSGKMKENDAFTFKFTEADTFPYYCSRHEGMTGKIIVK